MIKKIAHRILNQNDLLTLPNEWGVEFDLHSYNDKLVVVHDAFSDGIKLEKFLEFVNGRFLAVNIKEEGIEKKVDSGEAKVGFALFPTQMDNIISFADKKLNMPPKSTWFDPKPLDGLVAYDFE